MDAGTQTLERHVSMLAEGHLSRPVNRVQRAIIVRKLQRDYGTRYVQQLIERISRRRLKNIRAEITTVGVRDEDSVQVSE